MRRAAARLTIIVACALLACTATETHRVGDVATSPLWSGGSSTTTLPLRPDQTGTVGTFMLINTRPDRATLASIQPTDVDGLVIVGIQLHRTGADMVGTSSTYPAYPDSERADVKGFSIDPSDGPDHEIQVVVGVRLASGRVSGRLSGYDVTFDEGGTHFVLHTDQQVIVPTA